MKAMYEKDKTEPFWWGLFSFGGIIAALLVPIHIFIVGLIGPLGLVEEEVLNYDRIRDLVGYPLVKVYFFSLMAFPFYHAAHRARFTLYELGIRETHLPLRILCYGFAFFGTIISAYILFLLL